MQQEEDGMTKVKKTVALTIVNRIKLTTQYQS